MKTETPSITERFDRQERRRKQRAAQSPPADDRQLRDAMIVEYHQMASSALQLLKMLEEQQFVFALPEKQLHEYEGILLRLVQSATQCQDFVDASRQLDEQALLAALPAAPRIN